MIKYSITAIPFDEGLHGNLRMGGIAYETKNMIFGNSKRPLIIFGWGVHLAKAEVEAVEFAHRLGVPVICTWGAADIFRYDDPLYIGTFGTHGIRAANFALQNADVVLSIGSRLDTKATGSPAKDFAKKAKIYMVDIDDAEIQKFHRLGREIMGIHADAKDFMTKCLFTPCLQSEWLLRIAEWKDKYPVREVADLDEGINPYRFIEKLSTLLKPDDVIVSDTGCPLGWMMQAFKFTGQRFYHAWNNTPMGYGLPASIGASFAAPNRRIILITGDGGLSVNVTEFATIERHKLNIKIILFNNRGHAMCRQTQRTWMGGTYPSTSYEGGLATPDFKAVAGAYGIPAFSEFNSNDPLAAILHTDGPAFMELDIHRDYQIVPQVTFGKPLEDADPPLDRMELAEIMQ